MAKARARSNIALIKYWGKEDVERNVPAVGSLSMTLFGLHTTTEVRFRDDLAADDIFLNGEKASEKEANRISRFLDRVRKMADMSRCAEVHTENNFPTASGLASSASGFAALAKAATAAAGLDLDPDALADLARLGSGSAPRSLVGGLASFSLSADHPRTSPILRQLLPPEAWDLRLLVAVNRRPFKPIGSTEGMERSRRTSAYYPAWVNGHPADMQDAVNAIEARDFTRLGELAENSCFKMHAAMLASRPPLLYWNPGTVEAIQAVWDLRHNGVEAYVTIDAGSHVKALCLPDAVEPLKAALESCAGIERVMVEKPGPGVEIRP